MFRQGRIIEADLREESMDCAQTIIATTNTIPTFLLKMFEE
jgi:hypothetical protein